MDLEAIKRQAQAEIDQEDFRAAVDRYKKVLRTRSQFWNRLWPWKIVILRKDQLDV